MVALSLLRHGNLKKDNYKHVGVIRPPTWLFINEINKNRSKLKPCSEKVGREKTPTPKNERKEIELRSKGREGGKNLDNPSLVREGTAKSASHEDCNPLTRPIPTPPLSMNGSFFWLNASIDPRRSKSTT